MSGESDDEVISTTGNGWAGYRMGSGVIKLDSRGLGKMKDFSTYILPRALVSSAVLSEVGLADDHGHCEQRREESRQVLAKPDVISRYSLISPRTDSASIPQVQASQEGSLGSVNMANATTHDCVR